MAIKWRVRRVLKTMVATGLCLLVYLLVTGVPPSSKSLPPSQGISARQLTYINRPLDLSSPAERKSRLQRIDSACASNPDGSTMNILLYEPERKPSLRMSYCVVPKAGCTFWIRIFRFLNNDTAGTNPRTPFQIDRILAHDASQRTMKMYRLQNQEDRLLIENSTRFMFSRDPFTRVWSAYLDKLFLPNLWRFTGREIVSRRSRATARSLHCGNDVTFQEFVEYIVHQSETNGAHTLNGHWRPIQYVCDPCQFRPTFLGKQETFMGDSRTILSHLHLQHLLHGYDSDIHVRDELNILSDYNFLLLESINAGPIQCSSATQLAHRLWASFQLNGYLSPFRNSSVLEEVGGDDRMTLDAFKRIVFREQERHWEEIQQAAATYRRRSLVEAYRALPPELLNKFLDLYTMDFDFFGYDKRPEKIFSQNVKI